MRLLVACMAVSVSLGTAQTLPVEGPALYRAYCASCHGGEGKGDGPMAKNLKRRVPDLTRISARNGRQFPVARVSEIISGATEVRGGHGNREMPVWGPVFSQVDADKDFGRVRVDNLARYLRAMQER